MPSEHIDNREEKLQVRMTAAEKSECIRAARSESLSLSSWVRQVAIKRARELAARKGTP